MTRRRLAAAVLVAGLAATGCGGDDTGVAPTEPGDALAPTIPPPVTEAPAEADPAAPTDAAAPTTATVPDGLIAAR